jgi:hypothetical protein
MAKKVVDGFGNTPKVAVGLSDARRAVLAQDDWFVEYLNTDTRNALAHSLELVDHDGDQIFYDGEIHYGFKVTLDKVLFLRGSRHNGVFKFIPYHKVKHEKNWRKWIEQKKPPKTIVNIHTKAGRLKLATAF